MLMLFEELDLFTSSSEEAKEIAATLHDCGCCPRCILRFLGEVHISAYGFEPEDIGKLFSLKESVSLETETSVCPCPVCLGILQKFTTKNFFAQIEEVVSQSGYEFSSQQCSLIVPVSLIVRQKAMFTHLQKKFGETYSGKEQRIASVKDVWKWTCGRRVGEILGVQFENRSAFDILMTFKYQDSDRECSFLLDTEPEKFRRRKQKQFGFETFTRNGVAKALSQMSASKFEANVICPPKLPAAIPTCEIKCSHEPVFIAGRYQKYSRKLSQTPWVVDGKRIMEGSVEEIICGPIISMFEPREHKLSSSGREDVDVRMLGIGRPFVVELIDPHKVKFSPEKIKELQQEINDSSKDAQVRDLQLVSREETSELKEGEVAKTKNYSAVCWCERELLDSDFDKLRSLKDLKLHQKTPLRVLHRRSAAIRERLVHSMDGRNLGDYRFQLSLKTQAGTYIKEFVHGDFGRTSPNMIELMGAECDIISLDVEAVDVDWPPYLDPLPSQTGQEVSEESSMNSTNNQGDEVTKQQETDDIGTENCSEDSVIKSMCS